MPSSGSIAQNLMDEMLTFSILFLSAWSTLAARFKSSIIAKNRAENVI